MKRAWAVLALAAASAAVGAEAPPPSPATLAGFSGAWRLDPARSDDAREKLRAQRDRSGSAATPAGARVEAGAARASGWGASEEAGGAAAGPAGRGTARTRSRGRPCVTSWRARRP